MINLYAKTQRNTASPGIRDLTDAEMVEFAQRMVLTADGYGMAVETCTEAIDLSSVGVRYGSCIDRKLIEGCWAAG